jgi:hypothetical protein
MDDLFGDIIKGLSAAMPLEEMALPPELARTRYPFGALELVCRNWRSERLHKVYAMLMKVKIPSLDIIGMAFHPEPCYDIPLFQFDLTGAKKKIIAYINVMAPRDEDAGGRSSLALFEPLRRHYDHLHPFKMAEWMQDYNTACTVYVDPEPARLEDLKACVREYFTLYLQLLVKAEKISDPGRIAAAERFHETYKNDLVTKDRSQIMLGKVIGREKAGRIFREVLI